VFAVASEVYGSKVILTVEDQVELAAVTVGDVLTCSSKGALSYRWSSGYNESALVTYGKTVRISQPGAFSYKCTVFVDSDGVICSFSRNISGFAYEIGITGLR